MTFYIYKKLILLTALGVMSNIQAENIFPKKRVIIYVWDGLRPDALTDKFAQIPNLRKLAKNGVEFKDNHSAYPTFTMDNAQAFATGDYAGKSGFYGNVLYEPWRAKNSTLYPVAHNAKGEDITPAFFQPIFTEDYEILKDLDAQSLDKEHDEPLVQVTTLLQEAHKAGLKTAVVGKSGPAFFQDYKFAGIIFDENHVWPIEFAKELQQKNIPLPKNTAVLYQNSEFALAKNNGNPTAPKEFVYLKDETNAANPRQGIKSPFSNANEYMADIFINEIIPNKQPDLSILWMRNPDTTEHVYGPGSLAYYDALSANDRILGKLLAKLKSLNNEKNTDIIIVSDHAHSNVLATQLNDKNKSPRLLVPLHEITNEGKIGKATMAKIKINSITKEKYLITSGYSTSGAIRTADLITQAHLKTENGKEIYAYDGGGCGFNFALSAMRLNSGELDKTSSSYHAADGKCLNEKNENSAYSSPSSFVPQKLNEENREDIVIGANGGSDYVYIPSHKKEVAKILIEFFQRREEYSALFIDALLYPDFSQFAPGVLPLARVKLQNQSHRNPDIVVSMTNNPNVFVNGLPGTEFDSESNYFERGSHGSFGRIDVHNTLLASGPDFKEKMKDKLPTGNVDVAPTVAHLLHLNMPNTDGRPLLEALSATKISAQHYKVTPLVLKSNLACHLNIYYPTTHPINFKTDTIQTDKNVDSFYTKLHAQVVTLNNKEKFTYFDWAMGIREKGCK